MAVRQLEFFRVLRGQVPGNDPFVPAIPCTCNAVIYLLHASRGVGYPGAPAAWPKRSW